MVDHCGWRPKFDCKRPATSLQLEAWRDSANVFWERRVFQGNDRQKVSRGLQRNECSPRAWSVLPLWRVQEPEVRHNIAERNRLRRSTADHAEHVLRRRTHEFPSAL